VSGHEELSTIINKGQGVSGPNDGSGSPQILCPNLIQFGQVVVSKHLWDSPDRISSWATQLLFGQVGLINAHSQLSARIVSNSDKEFEGILIPLAWGAWAPSHSVAPPLILWRIVLIFGYRWFNDTFKSGSRYYGLIVVDISHQQDFARSISIAFRQWKILLFFYNNNKIK
jgi:hypothetical protein